jgi:hypothetical protein
MVLGTNTTARRRGSRRHDDEEIDRFALVLKGVRAHPGDDGEG